MALWRRRRAWIVGWIIALLIAYPGTGALAQVAGQTGPHILAAPRAAVRQAPARPSPAKTHVPAPKPGRAPHPVFLPLPPKAPSGEHAGAGETAGESKTAVAKPLPAPDQTAKGSVTGLPLPRFAALRADEVNLRAGPGQRFPIEWLYKRRGLPVQIEREFEVWRLVTVPDGAKGWVHEATLVGRRDLLVSGGDRILRASAADNARAVAILKPGVVGRIRDCAAGAEWCRVQVGDYRGWLRRSDFWGALPGEAIAPS